MIEHHSADCICEGKPCKRCRALRCIGDYRQIFGKPGTLCRLCVSQARKLNDLLLPPAEKQYRQARRKLRDIATRAKRRAQKRQSGGSYTATEWEALKVHYN